MPVIQTVLLFLPVLIFLSYDFYAREYGNKYKEKKNGYKDYISFYKYGKSWNEKIPHGIWLVQLFWMLLYLAVYPSLPFREYY